MAKNLITRKNLIITIALTVFFFVTQCILQMSTTNVYSATHQEKYSDSMSLVDMTDVTVSGDLCSFQGKNPTFVYELDNSYYYVNALIKFSAPLEHDERIVIDYAGNSGEYTYWEGDVLYLNKGQTYVLTPLSTAWDIKTFKIMVAPSLYDYPSIESVSLQRTGKMSKLSLLFAWLNRGGLWIRLLTLSLAMGMLLTGFISRCDIANLGLRKNRYIINLYAIGIIVVAVVILYQEYIFGSRLFVFTDSAGDSAGLFYPTHINWARWADKGIGNGAIDFTYGLGSDAVVSAMQFTAVAALFGEHNVAAALLVLQMLMVIVAGICIYFTGVLYSDNRKAALVMALSYAFCAEFTIRAPWLSYSYTMLFVAIWLLSFELLYRKNIWYIMPIPVMLMLQHMGTFYQVLWIILLGGYIIIRFMMYDGKGALKKCAISECIYIICVLFFQRGLVNNILWNLRGERFQNGIGSFINSSEETNLIKAGVSSFLAPQKNLFPGFLRTIGQNIGGITVNYRGGNYLLDLTLYSGILILLLVPIALYNMPSKKRRAYGVLVIASMAYIFIYPITMIMTAFTGLYKLSSQWIMIAMIFVGLEGLMVIMQNKSLRKGSMIILFLSDLAIFIMSFLAIKKGYVLDKKLLLMSLLFVCLYSLLFVIYFTWKTSRKCIANMMIIAFIVEVLAVSWATFNDRRTFSKEYNPYYDDGTISAINYLEEKDNSFYRIEKQSPTMEDNDSMAQGYYGTRLYFGGGNNLKGEYFYKYLGLPFQEQYRLKGVASDLYSMTILGVKYYFSADNLPDKYGYHFVDRIDGVSIYRSDYAMPAVYATDRVYLDSELSMLDDYSKRQNLVGGVLVGDNVETIVSSVKPAKYELDKNIIRHIDAQYKEGEGYYPVIDNRSVLLVRYKLSDKINATEYSYRTINGQEEVLYFGTQEGENILEICVDNLEAVNFSDLFYQYLEEIDFYVADRDIYYDEYKQRASSVSRMETVVCDDDCNRLEGVIDVKADGVLVTQYPSCDIMIDGVAQDTFGVNTIFTGCNISEGKHRVCIYRDTEKIRINSVSKVFSDLFFDSWFRALIIIPLGVLINYLLKRYRKVEG